MKVTLRQIVVDNSIAHKRKITLVIERIFFLISILMHLNEGCRVHMELLYWGLMSIKPTKGEPLCFKQKQNRGI